jgi:hypothetical protein
MATLPADHLYFTGTGCVYSGSAHGKLVVATVRLRAGSGGDETAVTRSSPLLLRATSRSINAHDREITPDAGEAGVTRHRRVLPNKNDGPSRGRAV